MIDATTEPDRPASEAAPEPPAQAAAGVAVDRFDAGAHASYRAFCRDAVLSPSQHPLWIESWLCAHEREGLMITLNRDGRAVMRMVLEIVGIGRVTVCRYPGGNHANGNMPALAPGTHAPITAAEWQAVGNALSAARPDIDLVALRRHIPRLDGMDNPLAGLSSARSPDVGLAVDVSDGFDALLARMSGKRKRKKYRLQERKFAEAGGYRFVEAGTPQEVERLVSAFFTLKAERFREMGVADAFADPGVRAFYRSLFLGALDEDGQPFRIDALEVGGRIRALNGVSLTRERVVCDFGAISNEDTTSPGYFLDYEHIRKSAGEGYAVFDFSVGDEDYKRSWCEIEIAQFDVFMPLTVRGRAMHLSQTLRGRLVRFLKSNRAMWDFVKKTRRRLAGAS